jgi:mono/diheme cytochrome c family protein
MTRSAAKTAHGGAAGTARPAKARASLVPSALAAAVLATVVLAGVPASAGDDEEASDVLVEMGRVYYDRHCATCHGATARGGGPAARALKEAPPDLTRIAARRGGSFPSEELSAFIDGRTLPAAHGDREMPIWGRTFSRDFGGGETGDEVSRGRVIALLEYLRTLQRK